MKRPAVNAHYRGLLSVAPKRTNTGMSDLGLGTSIEGIETVRLQDAKRMARYVTNVEVLAVYEGRVGETLELPDDIFDRLLDLDDPRAMPFYAALQKLLGRQAAGQSLESMASILQPPNTTACGSGDAPDLHVVF